MSSLTSSVGLRNRSQKVASLRADQETVLNLLGQIPASNGGKKESFLLTPISPGADGECPQALADAIFDFQKLWIKRGELRVADAVVDKDGATHRKLDALAGSKVLPQPGDIVVDGIILRQSNEPAKAALHQVSHPVVRPSSITLPQLIQTELQANIREFRFQVVKPQGTFWVGVAVPEGTADFTRAHVFFHPTPIQNGIVRAADGDYPKFVGGWTKRIEKYMPRHGCQMAAARKLPLIIPYMTMASAKMEPQFNVFADDPAKTLNAILAATQALTLGDGFARPTIVAISTSSYSSGITYLSSFLDVMKPTGLVVEAMDFDSTFIVSAHPIVSGVPGGGNFVQFTQRDSKVPRPGHFDLPPRVWVNTKMNDLDGNPLTVHGKIGWMTFFTAMSVSILPSS